MGSLGVKMSGVKNRMKVAKRPKRVQTRTQGARPWRIRRYNKTRETYTFDAVPYNRFARNKLGRALLWAEELAIGWEVSHERFGKLFADIIEIVDSFYARPHRLIYIPEEDEEGLVEMDIFDSAPTPMVWSEYDDIDLALRGIWVNSQTKAASPVPLFLSPTDIFYEFMTE